MQNLEKASQRTTLTLLAGQSLFSAAIIMGFTIGSIIAVQLANGNSQWTGVPAALGVIGAALIAYPIGRLMDRVGRRIGLSIGYVIGISGTLIAAWGVINQSLFIFLIGFFGLGMTRGVLDLARYAAAEASPARRRARAISWVVLGGTVGSILGPSLIEITNNLADRMGLPGLSGPWFAAAIFFAAGLVIINIFLHPDPQVIGRQVAALEPESATEQLKSGRPYRQIIKDPNALLATGTLIFAHVTMVAVMVVTPVHMEKHLHTLGSISVVIMAHTLGMFGLSFVTGWLVEKLGRTKVIVGGGLILALSCFMAPFSHGVPWLVVALFLLGLGWNFCFVAGSTMLTDVLRRAEKGRVQGLTDTLINIASGLASLSSGFAFKAFGFAAMSWFTILLGLVPIILVFYLRTARHQLALEGLASN